MKQQCHLNHHRNGTARCEWQLQCWVSENVVSLNSVLIGIHGLRRHQCRSVHRPHSVCFTFLQHHTRLDHVLLAHCAPCLRSMHHCSNCTTGRSEEGLTHARAVCLKTTIVARNINLKEWHLLIREAANATYGHHGRVPSIP